MIKSEQSKYFVDNRLKNRGGMETFSFPHTRISNSPYVTVRGRNHFEIIKEGDIDQGFIHNGSLDMGKNASRPVFVKAMGANVNENRFMLSDKYDKSTYLTKVSRPKAIVNFGKVSKRDSDLIIKGGD